MNGSVAATYYDGLTSKPWEAHVSVRDPNTLDVEIIVDASGRSERFQWPMEHRGMQWERSSGNMLRLSFGEHPRKVLVVRDELFIKAFALRMRYTGRQGPYDRLLSVARSGPVLFGLGLVALLVAGYLWILPWAAERMALLLPRTADERLGEAMYSGMMPSLSEDTARSAALQHFGDRLHVCPDYTPHFHVVDDEQVNAFAMPGGHIVVFTGLLDHIDEPEELAALLAHEGTHVQERHSTRMLMRNLSSYMFLSLLFGDVSAIVTVAAQNADNIRSIGYSRALETDADEVGQERMKADGVDPIGMVHLLRLLEKEAKDVPAAISFLSSHPLTAERIAKAEAKAHELGPVPVRDPLLVAAFDAVRKK